MTSKTFTNRQRPQDAGQGRTMGAERWAIAGSLLRPLQRAASVRMSHSITSTPVQHEYRNAPGAARDATPLQLLVQTWLGLSRVLFASLGVS